MFEKRYLHFLIYFIIIVTYLPVVYLHLPSGIKSLELFWGPLWLISVFFLNSKISTNRIVLLLIIFTVITSFILPNTLWLKRESLYGDYNFWRSVFFEFYYMLIGLSIFFYLHYNKDYFFWSRIVIIIISFIFISVILTIFSVYINPNYARELTNSNLGFSKTEEGKFIRSIGGATYGYLQTFVVIIPSIVYLYRTRINKFNGPMLIALILLILLSTTLTQFFANILVALVILLFSLQGSKNIRKSLLYLFITLFILLILPSDFFVYLIDIFSSFFSRSSENYFKLKEFSNVIEYGSVLGSGAIDNRLERYPLLLDAIGRSPFWGNSASNNPLFIQLGTQHLFFMGRLAEFGIPLFVIYVIIYYKAFKYQIRLFYNSNYFYYYLLALTSFIALGLMKNIAGKTMWFTLFVYLPGVYYFSIINKSKNK